MATYWEGHDRGEHLPPDWPALRRTAQARAGGLCQCKACTRHIECKGVGTDCDHIDGRDNHTLENLQWLCRPCHEAKTVRQREAKRGSRLREAPRHPGDR